MSRTGGMHLEMVSRASRRPPSSRCATLGVGAAGPRRSLAGDEVSLRADHTPGLARAGQGILSRSVTASERVHAAPQKSDGRQRRPPRLGRSSGADGLGSALYARLKGHQVNTK